MRLLVSVGVPGRQLKVGTQRDIHSLLLPPFGRNADPPCVSLFLQVKQQEEEEKLERKEGREGGREERKVSQK